MPTKLASKTLQSVCLPSMEPLCEKYYSINYWRLYIIFSFFLILIVIVFAFLESVFMLFQKRKILQKELFIKIIIKNLPLKQCTFGLETVSLRPRSSICSDVKTHSFGPENPLLLAHIIIHLSLSLLHNGKKTGSHTFLSVWLPECGV